MSTLMIQAKYINKSYGHPPNQTQVLKETEYEQSQGTFNVIYGRSGSGKSTFLHLIAGLEHPDAGEIYVQDEKIHSKSSEELAQYRLNHVGIVFQFFNLLPTLTIKDNIAIPGQLQGMKNKILKERVENCIEAVGLNKEAHRLPHQVSGGEIQRAAIARALMNRPSILLADEPSGNLDLKNRDKMIEIFSELKEKEKMTILVVTHDEAFIERADEKYKLKEGKLVKQITKQPQH